MTDTTNKVNPLELAAWRLYNQAAILRSPDRLRDAAEAFRAAGLSEAAESAERQAELYAGMRESVK